MLLFLNQYHFVFSLIQFLSKWVSVHFSALLMLSLNEYKHLHHQKQTASYHPECPGRSPQKQELTSKNGSAKTELMGGLSGKKMAYKLYWNSNLVPWYPHFSACYWSIVIIKLNSDHLIKTFNLKLNFLKL